MSDLEEAGRGKKVNMKMGNQIALTTKRFVYIHVKFLILISNMFFFTNNECWKRMVLQRNNRIFRLAVGQAC